MTQQRSDDRDVRWAKALAHPLRVQLIEQFIGVEIANPAMLARALGAAPSTVGYHVLRLEDLGVVEFHSQSTVRGFTMNRYRLTDRTAATLALEQANDLAASAKVPLNPQTTRRLAELGEALRALREAQRMSLSDVARRASIAATTLELIERGDVDPRMDTVYRIADALGLTLLEVVHAMA